MDLQVKVVNRYLVIDMQTTLLSALSSLTLEMTRKSWLSSASA